MVNETKKSSLVNRVVKCAEKTNTGVERSHSFSVDPIMTKLNESKVTRAPCTSFKEWTHDHQGLEFTLPVTIPPTPTNFSSNLRRSRFR